MMNDMPSTSTDSEAQGTLRDVVCPFCALVCDDLSLGLRNGAPASDGPDCPRAQQGFATALRPVDPRPLLQGRPVQPQQALEHAAGLLTRAVRPLFHGLLGDLQDARAAWRLAEHFAGVVDHQAGDAIAAGLRVYQSTGWQTTSLGELRNRADLVLRIGDVDLPRLREKLFVAPGRLHRDAPPELVELDGDPLALLDQLRLLRRGRRPAALLPQSEDLHRRLSGAAYPVLLIGRLPPGRADQRRSRSAYQVIASVSSGARSAAPPGKRGVGTPAITSKRSACPASASAITAPAKLPIATPWPE